MPAPDPCPLSKRKCMAFACLRANKCHKQFLANLKEGDEVVRMLGGTVPMPLKVTSIDEHHIKCGNWEFDRKLGIEIDEAMGWGVVQGQTGSFLLPPLQ